MWNDALFNFAIPIGDPAVHYSGRLAISSPGQHLFTFRFKMDDGPAWIYADTDGGANGVAADKLGTATVSAP